MDLTIVHRLGIALALGLVVGIERGWQARESTEGLRNIGVRTIAVVTNTMVTMLLAVLLGGWALARWVVPILCSTLLVGAALAFRF